MKTHIARAALAALLLVGCSSSNDNDTSDATTEGPTTQRIVGSVTITSDDDWRTDNFSTHSGQTCYGIQDHRDINDGSQVVVRAGGDIIATADLDEGISRSPGCRFAFTIEDIPGDLDYYEITVGSVERAFSSADLDEASWRVWLTTGGS